MFKTPLPFFLKKSNFENASPLNYLNSFCINNKYDDFEKLKDKDSEFKEIAKNSVPFCSECGALFNKAYKYSNSDTLWHCPFCDPTGNIQNKFMPDLDIPSNCYFSSQRTPSAWEDKILIVLCLDYSSSMNCTYYPLEKKEEISDSLKDRKKKELLEVNMVSRKKIMISALDVFLTSLLDKSTRFDIRVFVIVFNNEVKLLGNCRKKEIILAGDNLMDLDFCFNVGKTSARDLCSSKFDKIAKDRILNTLNKLNTYKETALGPAIATGLGVLEAFVESEREKDRFKNCFFNIFADGKSDVGLGRLDFSEKGKEMIETSFYEKMNGLALKHYPIFNFITFGEEVSRRKVFKSKLMKKLNGKLFQIKVVREMVEEFYDEIEINNFFYDLFENIFERKLMKLSIYQIPNAGLVFCEKKKKNVQKNDKNCKFSKSWCFLEGEPIVGVYFDYEKALENKENIHFQIQIEFFNLLSKTNEVFVSSFQQKFWKESEAKNYKNICDKETLQLILRLQSEKKNFEKNCLEILSNIDLSFKKNPSIFNTLTEAIKWIISEGKNKKPLTFEEKKVEDENKIVEEEKKLEEDKKIEMDKKPQEEKIFIEIKNDKKIDQNKPQDDDPQNKLKELENDRKTTENFLSKKKQLNSLSFNTIGFKDQSQNFHIEHKFNETESEQFDVQGDSFKDQSKAFNHKEQKWEEKEPFREQINYEKINELKNQSFKILNNDNIEVKAIKKEDENDGGCQLKEEQRNLIADVEENDQSRKFSPKEDKHDKNKNEEEERKSNDLEGRSKENSQIIEDKDQGRRFWHKEYTHHKYEKETLEEESQEESQNTQKNMEDKDQSKRFLPKESKYHKYENEEEERKSNALEGGYKKENQNNQIIEEKDQSTQFFPKDNKHDKIDEEERKSKAFEGESKEESQNFITEQKTINDLTNKDQCEQDFHKENKIYKSEYEVEKHQLLEGNLKYESDNFQNKQFKKKKSSSDNHSSIAFKEESQILMQKVHIYDAEDQSRNFENKDQSRNFSHEEHKFDIDEDIQDQNDNGTSVGFKDQSQSVFQMKIKFQGDYGDENK